MKKIWIIRILIILWIIFIFFNSLQIGSVSAETSGTITQLLHNLLGKIGITINIVKLSYIVRKLAHISEFFILGILVVLHEWQNDFSKYKKLLHVLVICLLIAVVDEVIQTFIPERAGLLVDVGIDMIGASLASILVLIFPLKNTTLGKRK